MTGSQNGPLKEAHKEYDLIETNWLRFAQIIRIQVYHFKYFASFKTNHKSLTKPFESMTF